MGGHDENGGFLNNGGVYDPSADAWELISGDPSLSGRRRYSATWTGTHLVIWGGIDSGTGNPVNTGARFNLQTKAWAPMTTTNAPEARTGHSAASVNGKVVIWGGGAYDDVNAELLMFKSGAIYDPVTDSWSALTTEGAPGPRAGHIAIGAGDFMIIFGGIRMPFNVMTGYYQPFFDGGIWKP